MKECCGHKRRMNGIWTFTITGEIQVLILTSINMAVFGDVVL
jgi:hypothetical protein